MQRGHATARPHGPKRCVIPQVFISYRREDSAASAGRLFDRLRAHCGAANVFRDVDTIAPGAEFSRLIGERIGACDALVAVIGKRWLEPTDAQGARRLDDPQDLVRAEIREALDVGKPVIPVLVDGASMPRAADLPADLAALAGRHAIEITDSRFDYDAACLLKAIDPKGAWAQEMPAGSTATVPADSTAARQASFWAWISNADRQRTPTFLGGALAAAIAAGSTLYTHNSTDKPADKASAAPSTWALSNPRRANRKGTQKTGRSNRP